MGQGQERSFEHDAVKSREHALDRLAEPRYKFRDPVQVTGDKSQEGQHTQAFEYAFLHFRPVTFTARPGGLSAEGFERTTDADKARFFDIAKGSSGEVRSMYYAAEDIKYVSGEIALQRRERTIKISKGIATLTSRFRQ